MPGLSYCSTLHLSSPFLFSLHLVLVGTTEIILQSCGKNNFPEREYYFSFSQEIIFNSYCFHIMPRICEISTADLFCVSCPTVTGVLRKTSTLCVWMAEIPLTHIQQRMWNPQCHIGLEVQWIIQDKDDDDKFWKKIRISVDWRSK